MSKQRKTVRYGPDVSPTLDQASALVQEYTGKLRAISRQIRDVRDKYRAARERRFKPSPVNQTIPVTHSPEEQQFWFEEMDGFRSQHEAHARYVRAVVPQARKLAQHLSQIITHGIDIDQTIVKLDLSLRVAELECAIETAQTLSNANFAFSGY